MLTDIHSCLTDLKATAMLLEETGMLLDGKYLKRIPSSGNKTQITVLSCTNAVGVNLPLIVIVKGECFNYEWTKG